MILYFDNYITDIPYKGKALTVPKNNYRSKIPIYKMPSRLEISKYALASYAVYPWSNILIKFQIDDPSEAAHFENYARSLFPNAIIIKNRSATQAEYKKSLEILEKMPDEWIFFAPNNDHIMLLKSKAQIEYINRLIQRAEKLMQTHKYASVIYSHFTEYVNVCRPKLPIFDLSPESKILEEDEEAICYTRPAGDFGSIQILPKKLFRHFFTSTELGEQRASRLEDLGGKVLITDQVEVVPKEELVFHFEGYEHTLGGRSEIRVDQIPSLFIPPGFFENNIKIAFGYPNYRPGWVNINPAAKKFSFEDPNFGTDLKIGLEDIPLFWKKRISEMDVNKHANLTELEKGRRKQREILLNPWLLKNQGLNFKTLRFRIKRPILRLYKPLKNLGLMPFLLKLKKLLGFY